jgi:hypothetical protein
MKILLVCLLALLPLIAHAEDLGTLSANEVDPNFLPNPFGTGDLSDPNSVTNELGPYGNPYSPSSATNFEGITAPRLSDQEGKDRGTLSTNQYNPDSVRNPYGRYGSPYSPVSIKMPVGAGSLHNPIIPTNPYGHGLRIEGR